MCAAQTRERVYEFGPFHLEVGERRLLRAGEPVPLRPKILDTLVVLVENHGHLLEKDELLAALWTDSVVEETNRGTSTASWATCSRFRRRSLAPSSTS